MLTILIQVGIDNYIYNPMKLKFQIKSARVKCLAFHPSKPWIIASLHSGYIQIWDYNIMVIIAHYRAHNGPARAVDIHPQLPLFVTGGDDRLIKIWDFKQKRRLFTLKGHVDYIRSLFFHPELPWILSASDDQTMRIWNYQRRGCVNIIAGHSHYVMCAQFHPTKNYIVSCSLDSTIRLWDYSVLRKKHGETVSGSIFIGVEIECIRILNGHVKGCDWVCFHPTQNLIASGADDHTVKLWKYTDEVAWEQTTLSGHNNNVSCVVFDTKSQSTYLISCSEDRNLNIWDYQSKQVIDKQIRKDGRYWMLKMSRDGFLVGAGHDNGFQVWELYVDISAHNLIGNAILLSSGIRTFVYDLTAQKQSQIVLNYTQKEQDSVFYVSKFSPNRFDDTVFLLEIEQNGKKEFNIYKKSGLLLFTRIGGQFTGLWSCFISNNQLAYLINPNEIKFMVYDGDNGDKTMKQNFKLPNNQQIFRIFSSNNQNQIFIVTKQTIFKYDLMGRKLIAQISYEPKDLFKQAIIGKDKVVFGGKQLLLITSFQLEKIAIIRQKYFIYSAYWSRDNLIIYSTKLHLKYGITNGETGILKTLQEHTQLVYQRQDMNFIAFSTRRRLFQLQFPQSFEIDFKLLVLTKQWVKVADLVKSQLGKQKKSMISYLIQKGHSEIAMDLTDSSQEKFSLAVHSSNFQLASQICMQINSQEYWQRLGEQALKQGVFEAFEVASQKQQHYDRLNFLYSLQHNRTKLEKVLRIANKQDNKILAFNSALFLNNLEEQQHILRDCGLNALAELSSQISLGDLSERLKLLKCAKLTPVTPEDQIDASNWPHNDLQPSA